MKVILISGKSNSGKDTLANIIRTQLMHDHNKVIIIHYADLLKYLCQNYFGWDGIKDENGRALLQYVGTDIIRKQNPEYWVRFVANFFKMFKNEWEYAIIPDCRFPNEVSAMVDNGFDVTHVRIIRPDFISPLTEEQQKHPSETALDDTVPDFYIENKGTFKDLEETTSKWIKENLYGNES